MQAITTWSGDQEFLRNDYPASVIYAGEVYPSVEHAFQAAKTTDKAARDRIRSSTVRNAKKIGRSVQLIPNWDSIKCQVMEILVRQKFMDVNTSLALPLIKTGDAEILMVTPKDTFWGAVYDADSDEYDGENNLGKILMKVRSEMQIMNGTTLAPENMPATLANVLDSNDVEPGLTKALVALFASARDIKQKFGNDFDFDPNQVEAVVIDELNQFSDILKTLSENCVEIEQVIQNSTRTT